MRRGARLAHRALAAAGAGLLAAVAAAGFAAAQGAPPLVAVLRATGGAAAVQVERFRQALREIGHEDGRTIRLVEHTGEGDAAGLPGLAERIVAERPAVLIAMGPSPARAFEPQHPRSRSSP